MQVVERDERDMEEVGTARRIVTGQRGDLRLHLRRRFRHDVEGVSGAHGWECSMVWGRGRLVGVQFGPDFGGLVNFRRNPWRQGAVKPLCNARHIAVSVPYQRYRVTERSCT